MNNKFLLYLLFLNGLICFSQKKTFIEGIVNDINKNPMFGASVIAKKPNSNLILAYTSTNEKGFYKVYKQIVNRLSDIIKEINAA